MSEEIQQPLILRLQVDHMRQEIHKAIMDHNHDLNEYVGRLTAEAVSEENVSRIIREQLEINLRKIVADKIQWLIADTMREPQVMALLKIKLLQEFTKACATDENITPAEKPSNTK